MELAIPGVALGLFYVVSNQKKNNEENFENQTKLPNTNVPNRNFPNIHERNSEQPIESIELDQTNKTTVNNKYDGSAGAYTDKYFNQTDNNEDTKKKIVTEGQLLFTGPMIDHAMLYTKETEILVVSKNPRDQKTYEEDTVRIDFMDHSRRF